MHLNKPSYQKLKGMMHGFIDLIFESQGQYFVCDYKSNHLGEHYDQYQHASLQQNVESNNYDLQYLIYSLALHRYLQQNLPDYDPAIHFGGVYYFYLRGMTDELVTRDDEVDSEVGSELGTDNLSDSASKNSTGVFYKLISPQELAQLDQLFLGEEVLSEEVLSEKVLSEKVLGEQVSLEQVSDEQGLGEQS